MIQARTHAQKFVMIAGMLASFGCGPQFQPSQRITSKDATVASDAGDSVGSSDRPEKEYEFESLFKDEMVIKASQVDAATGCEKSFYDDDVRGAIKPWPSDLRKELVSVFKKMGIGELIQDSVKGIYLVPLDVIDDMELAAGLTCGFQEGLKSVILLNSKYFDDTEASAGAILTTIHTMKDLRTDLSSYTLVHELMHAIDNRYHLDEGKYPIGARRDAMKLSWEDLNRSKFDKIGIMSLTSASQSSSQSDANDLRYVASETNFITPYAMQNPIEDFADTITVYYIGTRTGRWPVWTVYDADLTETYSEDAEVIYEFDAEKVLENSPSHRKKMCMLAKLVFDDDDCEARLP